MINLIIFYRGDFIMEEVEVIIVGAGIAGCGLAYNLKRLGFSGRIVILEEKEIGGLNESYRNTFEEVIEEYDLPFEHKFKGIKIGAYDQEQFSLDINFYLLDYQKACSHLLKKSGVNVRREVAENIIGNIVITNKSAYKFRYIVDCSGINFFGKKLLNMNLPFRYWLGRIQEHNVISKSNKDYFQYQFSDKSYFEDFYKLKNKTIQGDWVYSDKIDFEKLKPHNKRLLDKFFRGFKAKKEYHCAIPCTPVFPIVYNNVAFLGDSFGNATTSAAEGIRPILESSKILAESIIKRDLKSFEVEWKKKYFNLYFKHLVTRIDGYSDNEFTKIFKYPKYSSFLKELGEHKDIVLKRLRNEDYKMPKEIVKKFPLHSLILRQFLCKSYLKYKYALM